MTKFATILLTVTMANSSFAEVVVPEGCEPVATIMKSECTATTVMQCDGLHYEDTYQDGKRVARHVFGPDWDLREYTHEADAATVIFDENSGPGLNLRSLLEDGTDLANREGSLSTRVLRDRKVLIEAEYTLKDETVTISGIEFRTGLIKRVFIFNPKNRALDSIWEFDLYVSRERNLMIEGSSKVTRDGREFLEDSTPYSVAFANDEGFLADRSGKGCDG